MSSLAEIVKAASAKARERRILLPVPNGPVTLLCRTLRQDEIGAAKRLGKRLAPKDDMKSSLIMSKALLADATVEIWVDGETWADAEGLPLTFADKELHAALGVADRLDAVAETVGRDGDLETMSNVLIRESGYDSEGYETSEADAPT